MTEEGRDGFPLSQPTLRPYVISILLTASDDAKALARLLAALVPAAADGLVREAAVIGAAGASLAVADDAGADLYAAGAFGEAVSRAKGPWIAGLPLAGALALDWMETLAAHLAQAPAAPARLVGPARLFRLGRGAEGWLVPKPPAASAVVMEEDLQRLARRGGRRLRILDRLR